MLTQTAERQELQRMIEKLPDDRIPITLDFIKGILPHAEADDGHLPHIPNTETLEVLKEVESGDLLSFGAKEKLFEYLNSLDSSLEEARRGEAYQYMGKSTFK